VTQYLAAQARPFKAGIAVALGARLSHPTRTMSGAGAWWNTPGVADHLLRGIDVEQRSDTAPQR